MSLLVGKDSLESNTGSGSARTSNLDLPTIPDLMQSGGRYARTFPLRCAIGCGVLYSGSDDIDFEYGEQELDRDYSYDFELRVHACNSYGSYWAGSCGNDERIDEHIHVCIDIKTLCDAICDSAEQCLQCVDEHELAKHGVRVVDVAGIAGLNRAE